MTSLKSAMGHKGLFGSTIFCAHHYGLPHQSCLWSVNKSPVYGIPERDAQNFQQPMLPSIAAIVTHFICLSTSLDFEPRCRPHMIPNCNREPISPFLMSTFWMNEFSSPVLCLCTVFDIRNTESSEWGVRTCRAGWCVLWLPFFLCKVTVPWEQFCC